MKKILMNPDPMVSVLPDVVATPIARLARFASAMATKRADAKMVAI